MSPAKALRDVRRVPDDRGHALIAIALLLPPELLPEALEIAAGLGDQERGEALDALAPQLPEALLDRALAAAEAIGDARARARALGALAARLPQAVEPALAAAEAIGEASTRGLLELEIWGLRGSTPELHPGWSRALRAACSGGRPQLISALVRREPDFIPRLYGEVALTNLADDLFLAGRWWP